MSSSFLSCAGAAALQAKSRLKKIPGLHCEKSREASDKAQAIKLSRLSIVNMHSLTNISRQEMRTMLLHHCLGSCQQGHQEW